MRRLLLPLQMPAAADYCKPRSDGYNIRNILTRTGQFPYTESAMHFAVSTAGLAARIIGSEMHTSTPRVYVPPRRQ